MRIRRKFLLLFFSFGFLLLALWIAGAGQVFHDFRKFNLIDLMWMSGLLGLNLFITVLRLKGVLSHFGISLPLKIAAKASMSGHVASLFVASLFGQVLGRHLVLANFGVRPVVIASLFAYERTILFILSSGLGVAGATWLLGESVILDFLKGMPLLGVVLVAGGGVVLSLILVRSKFEDSVLSSALSMRNAWNVLELIFLTLIGQLMVLGGFVIGILALKSDVYFLDALAAAAVISFAASMPLSVNGWGIRELAAVYVLGHLGVENSSAVAISIVVGLCATAIIILASPLAFGKIDESGVGGRLSPTAINPTAIDIEKAAALVLILVSGALVFFQVHLTLPEGAINLNLADPLAILALTVVFIQMISARELPSWRSDKFNLFIMLYSVTLLLSFGWGVRLIGLTQWAFGNRLIGWLVILGYLSLGYLAVVFLGSRGRRRLYITIVSTAVALIFYQIVLRLAEYSGLFVDLNIPKNFEGYSSNRNAFAFQLIVSLVLVMSYSVLRQKAGVYSSWISVRNSRNKITGLFDAAKSYKFGKEGQVYAFLVGALMAGIILSGSRAGIITLIVLLTFSWLSNWLDKRVILFGAVYALLVWMSAHVMWLLPKYYSGAQNGLIEAGVSYIGLHSRFSGQMSNIERWDSIILGLQMWLESPIVGAGLGVFIERSREWFDHPVVIHSTPIWMMAEFGLVGVGLCLWGLLNLLCPIYARGAERVSDRTVVMLLLAFVVFGFVHEIFYQRIFWLVLGAALAGRPIAGNIRRSKAIVKS